MAQVPFSAFYLGPLAVYPANTGLQDPITGAPEKGGNFYVGNYCDLSTQDALAYNQQYGTQLYQGRYRIVKISTLATAANIFYGAPAAWGQGTTLQRVVFVPGSGYTAGTYVLSSTTSGGTQAATATVVVGASGAIISATLGNPGFGFTSVPTFALTALGGGTGGSVLAQMSESANSVCSFDGGATQLSSVRGVFLAPVTAAQITAGAYVIIQELGTASVKVSTATTTAAGSIAIAGTGATVTTNVGTTAQAAGLIGYTLDLAAVNALVRVDLQLPNRAG